jgi:hypothetical protein
MWALFCEWIIRYTSFAATGVIGNVATVAENILGMYQIYLTSQYPHQYTDLVYRWTHVRNDNLIGLLHNGYIDKDDFLASCYGNYSNMAHYYQVNGFGPNTVAVFTAYENGQFDKATLVNKLGLTELTLAQTVGTRYLAAVDLHQLGLGISMAEADGIVSATLEDFADLTPTLAAELAALKDDPVAYAAFLAAIEEELGDHQSQIANFSQINTVSFQDFTVHNALGVQGQNHESSNNNKASEQTINHALFFVKIAEDVMGKSASVIDTTLNSNSVLSGGFLAFSSPFTGTDMVQETFGGAVVSDRR